MSRVISFGETFEEVLGDEVLDDLDELMRKPRSDEEFTNLMVAMAIVGICGMRTAVGDDTTEDFLDAAYSDLDIPPLLDVRPVPLATH